LNAISKKCPNGRCDGLGNIVYQNTETFEKFWDYCEDCRTKRIMQDKVLFANIPEEFKDLTISSFDLNFYKTDISKKRAADAKKMVANYVRNFEKYKSQGKGLYLYSKVTGSGKTRLAVSLGNALLKKKNVSCKFISTINLLKSIQSTFGNKEGLTTDKLIQAVKNVDVLILDDIGAESPTSWVAELFLNLIDDRTVGRKITIYTSNCSIEQLKHDIRTRERINRSCASIWMPEENVREKLATVENQEMTTELLKWQGNKVG
jgi:DNA replication protein DnaC